MKSLDPDPLQGAFTLKGARLAILGYDADARDHALTLRRAENHVVIGVAPDTTCWARACADGFAVATPSAAVASAEIVVVLVRDHEAIWRMSEPHLAPGTLVVFRSARALESGACTRGGFDVVLATTVDDAHTGCRIAVHRDATGRALLRAVAYARASCGKDVALRATSVAAEADLELASIGERAGSLLAFAASHEVLPVRPLPPEAKRPEPEPDTGRPTWFHFMLARRSRM
jgi:ketol-acid reductoisomerase